MMEFGSKQPEKSAKNIPKRVPKLEAQKAPWANYGGSIRTPCAKAGSSKRHPVQRHIPSTHSQVREKLLVVRYAFIHQVGLWYVVRLDGFTFNHQTVHEAMSVAAQTIAWRARPISFMAGYRPRFLVT